MIELKHNSRYRREFKFFILRLFFNYQRVSAFKFPNYHLESTCSREYGIIRINKYRRKNKGYIRKIVKGLLFEIKRKIHFGFKYLYEFLLSGYKHNNITFLI